MLTIRLTVNGMTCEGCSSGLQSALEQHDGIEKVVANHETNSCEVNFDPERVSLQDITTWIEAAGFEPESPTS